jgi:hypothetical protein
MYLRSPAGVTGIIGSRCPNPRAHMPLMTLLFPAGSATRHVINIGVHSYWLIRLALSATRIASRSGSILEMVIFVAPLVMIMVEGQDMHFQAFLLVRAMLLIMVIQVSIIQNLDAK